ncbi:hypothetical protein [Hyphomicrobium sp. ghe19]|nr:hypothetical protein HYPP_01937 [Hyphomicrobium sp. ghe19]
MEELTLNKAEMAQLQQILLDVPLRFSGPIVGLLQASEARQRSSAEQPAQ